MATAHGSVGLITIGAVNPEPDNNSIRSDRRRLAARAAGVGFFVLLVLLGTSSKLPMGWDEGNAIARATMIAIWGKACLGQGPPGWQNPLSPETIEAGWQYTNQGEGHPALYGIVIAAGYSVTGAVLAPIDSWRFGPMLLLGIATGAMFYRMSREYNQVTGLAAVLALLLQPRLFAHGHFATCDSPLTACWILAWAAFPPSRDGWKQAVLFGALLGMTMSTKATGWIAPVPFVLWAAIYRDRRAAIALSIGLPVALATFYLLNPPLWYEPIGGLVTFLRLNANRELNVACFFLGRMYDLHHSLPWYNTFVWTAVVVPVGLLILALVGLVTVLRRGLSDQLGILLILNWMILLVVRALPGTPPHDGIRLFLPAFAFLAAIAGRGTGKLLNAAAWLPDVAKRRKQGRSAAELLRNMTRLAQTVIVLLFLVSATNLFWYAPQWLSYYNLVIGGLPGATRLGMEPTYYWDSLDGEVLDWLEANTAEDEKVLFGSSSPENLTLMRTWGTLPVEFQAEAPGRYRWYVIQRRPSACLPPDQWLLVHATPVYKKYIHGYGLGPWRMNVPLLEVYDYEDYVVAVRATGKE
jgi:4-amino-4-deoxy-L-arabinose transferase-like glycosyltransferase